MLKQWSLESQQFKAKLFNLLPEKGALIGFPIGIPLGGTAHNCSQIARNCEEFKEIAIAHKLNPLPLETLGAKLPKSLVYNIYSLKKLPGREREPFHLEFSCTHNNGPGSSTVAQGL